MSRSSRRLDRFATTFDREGLVANAGLILAGTLMERLGLSRLIDRWVRTGSTNPGPKIATVVAAMLAGGTHIDHVEMLRAGGTGRVLGFKPMARSTVGSFLRSFTFGRFRQLEAVLSRTRARAGRWSVGAHGFHEPGPEDRHGGRCDAGGRHSHRSRRDAARRRDRSGAGVQADGAVDGGAFLAVFHVRSLPPARSGAVTRR